MILRFLSMFAAALAWASAAAVAQGDIAVSDSYARAASPVAKSGAAYMTIANAGEADDRLLSVASEAAARTELHTHVRDGDVMRMVHVEAGFPVPAGGTLRLRRGAEHVMLMGLAAPMEQGDTITLTLRFERAGDVTVDVPVDLQRRPTPPE